MNPYLKTIQDILQQNKTLSEADKEALLKSISDADKQWSITDFKLDRTEKVKKTTAILLEETIEELEQKRKSVEAQNRELEIESSLERLRAVAMGMKKSDDLLGICEVLFKELQNLGFSHLRNTLINTFVDEQHYFIDYDFSDFAGGSSTRIPYSGHPVIEKYIEGATKKNDAFIEMVVTGKELEDWKEFRRANGETDDPRLDNIATLYYYNYSIGVAGIGISTFQPITQEKLEVLKRFRNVFDLAYRRYTDIQQAEEQARESQIQLAMERVRARTMAMQKSDELPEAANLLFLQVQSLGMSAWSAGYCIWDDNKKAITLWMSSEGVIQLPLRMPLTEDPYLMHFLEAHQRGESFFVEEVGGDALIEHYAYLRTLPGVKESLDDIEKAGFPVPTFQIFHLAYFSKGFLLFITYEPVPEAHEIFKRFGKVFDQTYTRFLDLQKAEAQAREAQIEAALEKVRSRSLAVHKSDEFKEVISVVFEKLQELGIPVEAASINIFVEGSKDTDVYACGHNENGLDIRKVRLRYFDHPIANDLYNAHKNGLDFFIGSYGMKEKNSYYEYQFKHADLKDLPAEIKERILQTERYSLSMAPARNSVIIINNFEGKLLSDREADIVKRFSRVFEQAYTRFLDLQKAEAQARESQIQLALERVRARTMAMQKSDELREAVLVLYEQLQQLNFNSNACNIIIIDKETSNAQYWVSGFSQEIFPQSYSVPYFNHPYQDALIKPWEEGDKYVVYEYAGKTKQSFDKIFFTQTEFRNVPADAKKVMIELKSVMLSTAFISYGALQSLGPGPLSEENANILQRFAKVFEQTYTRFLDLQKAEAQARESQIQLALERVRARTMAMQHSDELKDAAALLFQQVKSLGVPAYSCGYNIWEKDDKEFTSWMSTQDGSDFNAVLNIPLTEDANFIRFAESRKKGEQFFVLELRGERMQEHYQYLKTIPAFKAYFDYAVSVGFDLPETQIHHLANFSQGNLLFITLEPCPEFHDVFKRFAAVFEQTYTRFLDLQNAEAQAREAQIEAALERVRSRTMAMQKSGELKEVIQVVYAQFVHLNIHVEHTGIIIDYKTRDDMHIWLADKHAVPFQVTIPYFDSSHWNSFNEAKEKEKNFFTNHLSFEEKNKFYQDLFTLIPGVPEETLEYYFSCPGLAISTVLLENVGLYIENFSGIPYTIEENNTLMRFGKVFQQTYTRFLDLQKAEDQAREAKIEAALERTRTQSMIMQHSTELDNTLRVFHEQILLLGIQSEFSYLWLPDEDKERHIFWAAWAENLSSGQSDKNNSIVFKSKAVNYPLDRTEPATAQCLVDWKSDESIYSYVIPPAGVENYFATWKELLEGVERLKPVYFQGGLYYVEAFMKYGCFGVVIKNELLDEEKKILLRFSVEFERTYTRFLDLQKAEGQAREAQIEAALEKIRSRSLAMHQSDELEEVIMVVSEQLQQLQFRFHNASFVRYNEQQGLNFWLASPGQPQPYLIEVPYLDNPIYTRPLEALKNGVDFIADVLTPEENHIWLDHLLKYSVLKNVSEDDKKFLRGTGGFARSLVMTKHIILVIGNYAAVPYTDEENQILKRFGYVFEQAYTRFLDLQKAEAQTREARIENALEKVRSRTMAMQRSAELAEVATVLFQQVKALGVPQWTCGFSIFEIDDKEFTWYPGSADGDILPPVKIPLTEHPVFISFNESRKRGDELFVYEKEGEFQAGHYRYMQSLPGVREMLQKMLDAGLSFPTFQIDHLAHFSHGTLVFITYEPVPKMHDVFQRFAKVFEQTYTRFLDLQKAEAQTRESQIQLALERVRARTMAMQKSDELTDVAGLLFEQVTALDIKTWTAGFNVWSEDNNSYVDYITSPKGGFIEPYTVYTDTAEALTDLSNARKSGVEFDVQYVEGEKIKQLYLALTRLDEKQYEIMLQDGNQFPSHQYEHFVFGSKVSLMFITYDPVPEAHDIFKRFGKVFEQTYTRFNDLKQAEAQALEAIKRASVDRVRAEIASMRTTSDLERIQPLIWNELKTLDVPFIRCGVFIMDEEKKEVQTMLSTPGGQAIATLHVPFEFDLSIITNGVKYWRKKKVYTEYWDAAAFTKVWIKLSSLRETSVDSPQTEHPPEHLHLHMLPFLQGMLYVGSAGPLNEEQLQLVQNLAEAFATAYARYEDFNKLEAAKKQVDNTLNELQVTQKQLIQSEKMASLGELTAGIAHEIQNPLNFVNNFSDVSHELLDEMKTELEKGNNEDAMAIAEDVKHNLEKILHHGKRADAIVKGMLQHSRSGSGQKELTDINALADEYLRLAYHGLRAKDKSFNAALHHDFDKSIDKVNIIPQDIGRVLVNLINNAFYAVNVKARKNIPGYEPALTITTKKIADKVELRVSDNGVGIPSKVLDKIFHPFFTTKPTGQGTGLGLSMAYDIITKGHGGELKVKTKEGEGSEFCIQIPVSKTPA